MVRYAATSIGVLEKTQAEIAGRMRSIGGMSVLLPRIIADRIGEKFPPVEAGP